MSSISVSSQPRVFYGWCVVAAAFAIGLVGFGSAYTFSAFAGPMQRDFGASRGSIGIGFSLASFLNLGLGSLSGPAADRWGARRLAVAGMILTGLALASTGAAHSVAQMYVTYGLGVGFGVGCAYVPALGAVQRWFTRRRGLASGLAVSGIGVGTAVMPPIASRLIADFGWRGAYLLIGIIVAIAGAAAALMLEDDPRDRGLAPDGDVVVRGARSTQTAGISMREAVRSRTFISLYAACLTCALALFVPFVHLVPYAVDHGVSPSAAPLLFGGMALAFAIWAFSTTLWTLLVFATVYGLFYGGFIALLPTLVMDYFGGRHVSGIIGVLYTSVAVGTLIGPSAAGFAFDLGHSYLVPILASVCANVVAAGIVAATSKQSIARSAIAGEARRA
jgi:MFS family permease